MPTGDYECLTVDGTESLRFQGTEQNSLCRLEDTQDGALLILVLFVLVRIQAG